MSRLDNLVPIDNSRRSREEHSESSRKGGKASAEARRKKKTIKETINLMLSMPIINDKTKKQMQQLGYTDEDMINQTALVLAMYKKALNGDVSAFNTLSDRSGEVITQKVEKTDVPLIFDDIGGNKNGDMENNK